MLAAAGAVARRDHRQAGTDRTPEAAGGIVLLVMAAGFGQRLADAERQ